MWPQSLAGMLSDAMYYQNPNLCTNMCVSCELLRTREQYAAVIRHDQSANSNSRCQHDPIQLLVNAPASCTHPDSRWLTLAFPRLFAQWSQGYDETVEVNQRALIDKVLARYSGEFSVFRELLQNS